MSTNVHTKRRSSTLRDLPISLSKYNLVIFIMISSIVAPTIPLPGGFGMRLEDILALIILPILVPHIRLRFNRFDFIFTLLSFSVLISIAWGFFVMEVPFSPRDFFEIVKIARYWVFFRFALFNWQEKHIRLGMYWVAFGMALAAVIGILQWVDLFGARSFLQGVYGSTSVHDIERENRIIGTVGTPNTYAMLLVSGEAIILAMLRWSRHKLLLFLALFFVLLAVFLTFSRTGLVNAVIVAFVLIGLRIFERLSIKRMIIFMLVISLLFVGIYLSSGRWLFKQIQLVRQMRLRDQLLYSNRSLIHRIIVRFSRVDENERFAAWKNHLEIFRESPMLGWGPAKILSERWDAQYLSPHNEYILRLRQYGIVGMMGYLFLYVMILFSCLKIVRNASLSASRRSVGPALVAILVSYLLANIVTYTFASLILMPLFWSLMGMGYSQLYVEQG